MSIGQELRTVGQGLESLNVGDFDLQPEGNGYFVLGIPQIRVRSDEGSGFSKVVALQLVRNAWQSLIERKSSDRKLSDPGSDVLRILFTPEGLMRLEVAGVTMRNLAAPGNENSRKLSRVLRIVGEGIDAKSGRLFSIRKRRQCISFEYGTPADTHAIEEWKVSELYELWLDAFKQRRERVSTAERQLQDGRRWI
ncbi:MAG TPA: hypothetical protein VNT76_08950 [Candidatus Binatus sp.]|nr:hypothetical protein [Candidatus Binatus sp.]